MRRANNQDSFAAVVASSEERFGKVGHLFVVADGMGAHAAGELASKIAAEKIAHYYLRSDGVDASQALRQAMMSANSDIYRRGQENPEFHNMGTTASSLVLVPEGAVIGHVGDSRVYRLRGEAIEQLTFDHSLVWEMQAAGQVRPGSELASAIPKNVITRSLGPYPDVAVDLEGPLKVEVGDKFLLCSDGLTGQVTDEEIGALMMALEPDLAVRVLIDLANLRGGPDNITVIIAKVTNGSAEVARPIRPVKHSINEPLAAVCIAGVIAVIFLLVTKNYLLAIVPLIVSIVAGLWFAKQYYPAASNTFEPIKGPVRSTTSPYRRYSANPRPEMVQHFVETIEQISRAAEQRRWRINWEPIKSFELEAKERLNEKKPMLALRAMAMAINETMTQLRHQQTKAATESTVDL